MTWFFYACCSGSMRRFLKFPAWLAGAACVHYLAGKKSINRSGKCHSGLARLEISKIYACRPCSMRRKTTSLMFLPVHLTKKSTFN